jgi:hypothetical protein
VAPESSQRDSTMRAGCWKCDSNAVCERLTEGEVLAPINPGDEARVASPRPNWRAGVGLKSLCRVLSSIRNRSQESGHRKQVKFEVQLRVHDSMCSYSAMRRVSCRLICTGRQRRDVSCSALHWDLSWYLSPSPPLPSNGSERQVTTPEPQAERTRGQYVVGTEQ